MQFNPLGNRVLVKRIKAPESKGGIFLPETAQEKPKEGEVVAVGPGKEDKDGVVKPMEVNVGDRVLFGSYAGVEVQSEEGYMILNEDEILATLVNQ